MTPAEEAQKEDAMDMSKAWQLQREWKAKGNPPCDHPGYERELYQPGGMHTGDHVCTRCGAVVDPADFTDKRQPASSDEMPMTPADGTL